MMYVSFPHATEPVGLMVWIVKSAIRWWDKSGWRPEFTYGQLALATNRFANARGGLGVQPGKRVFVLMGWQPDLYVAVLGAPKAGCVTAALLSAFGPEPIATRAQLGEALALVTTADLYWGKLERIRHRLPGLRHVILVGKTASKTEAGGHDWIQTVDRTSSKYPIAATDPECTALLHFTRGMTGRPKGAMHVHGAVVAHIATGRYALDLHGQDVFWCTAGPDWITGSSYGIVAPQCCGVTSVVIEPSLTRSCDIRCCRTARLRAPPRDRGLAGGGKAKSARPVPRIERQNTYMDASRVASEFLKL